MTTFIKDRNGAALGGPYSRNGAALVQMPDGMLTDGDAVFDGIDQPKSQASEPGSNPMEKTNVTTRFIKTNSSFVNLDHVQQIEEIRSTRSMSLAFFSATEDELAMAGMPYAIPAGFIETRNSAIRSVRAGDVLRVLVNVRHVARGAPGQSGLMLYTDHGRVIGSCSKVDFDLA